MTVIYVTILVLLAVAIAWGYLAYVHDHTWPDDRPGYDAVAEFDAHRAKGDQ